MFCLTQLYDGRDMCRIYYIKIDYMFRYFTLAIFSLLDKYIHSNLVYYKRNGDDEPYYIKIAPTFFGVSHTIFRERIIRAC